MKRHGFVRVGTAAIRTRVANVDANVRAILELAEDAAGQGCEVIVFPELALTGYTCADLFQQSTLLNAAACGLAKLAQHWVNADALLAVGLPVSVGARLYNCAAVLHKGRVLGLVPKRFIPNYKEYYERRWFVPACGSEPPTVDLAGQRIPFGIDLLFATADSRLVVGIEICEDLWLPIPPSCAQALAGANLLLNLSASVENTGKAEYRRALVVNQSGRCVAAYAYAAAGVTESTTDLVFGGHSMIAENGQLLTESQRFERSPVLLTADVDVEQLAGDRQRMSTFADQSLPACQSFRRIEFALAGQDRPGGLRRRVPAHPFVPADSAQLAERCQEIFATQTAGLAKRLETAGPLESVHIGVSGGLDSTLALLVAVKTCDLLGWNRQTVHALNMPGFGTSTRTRSNAGKLMDLLGVSAEHIDIRPLCADLFRTLGHRPFGIDPAGQSVDQLQVLLAQVPDDDRHDLVFENVQARVRTLLLMSRGFVIGTGDLSELALGWCTYNGDHMSMYNPNVSIPKTLVRFLVRWVADNEYSGELRQVLHSVADTVISPELLPAGLDQEIQSTEGTVGPYELHDFFLFHMLRFGFGPHKILFLAEQASFDHEYSAGEIRHWLKVFYRRFFSQQFKRSCLPDGPKVGSVSLSPRGDWRMPSDADATAWIAELDGSPATA